MTGPIADEDRRFMGQAIDLAEQAAAAGEVPVGALVVKHGEVVAAGSNRPRASHDPTAHAEIIVLRAAGTALGAYRLPDTTLYVTLEPCPMCLGAMIHARIGRLVYGADDPKTGACGGAMRLHEHPSHNHDLLITGGVEAAHCGWLLRAFFQSRRG
jgi:tRNA(adenine34) deaminase